MNATPNCTDGRSLALQIYEAIKAQIEEGVYAPGNSLPSTRYLAAELGVSRSTVLAAYDRLIAEGCLKTHQGSRARVVGSVTVPSPACPATPTTNVEPRLSRYGRHLTGSALSANPFLVADFRHSDMAWCDFPTLYWKRVVNAVLLARKHLRYGDPAGCSTLRQALQGYLWRARGIRCKSDQIIIVNGSQQGLDLCARLLLDQGSKAVVEDPCYALARQTFLAVGAELCAIPVDHEGLQTSLLADIHKAQLAYVTPSHQFPLGSIMSATRRKEFLSWSERAGAYVIEDDYDFEYRLDTRPIQALRTLGSVDNIIYLGTFSKTLSPLLRLGYLVAPPSLVRAFTDAKRLADRGSPCLEQEALAQFILSGAYERHIVHIRRRVAQRRQLVLEHLSAALGNKIDIEGSAAGSHVVVWFKQIPASWEGELVAEALSAGVGIYPISPFYASPNNASRQDSAGIVLGYAGVTEREIAQGISRLAEVVETVVTRNTERRVA